MRKLMLLFTGSAMVVALVAVLCYPVLAAVRGPCSDCHTMHNSQGGETVVETSEGATDAQSALLVSDCLGCHTTTGTDPLVDGYPYVESSTADGFTDDRCLAGGFFVAGTDSSGDNDDVAHSVGNQNEPAGYNTAETTWYTGLTDGLGCAGSNGCHGSEDVVDDMEAISGGHHSPSAYRILYVNGTPVAGDGAVDYEESIINESAAGIVTSGDTQNVNIYSADTSSTDGTISELCAKCHGDFHNEVGTTADTGAGTAGDPWIRHPSDAPIPDDSWDIYDSTLTESDYKNNPVGYLDADDTNARMATCLSCHRAHGTENPDLLRWAYDTQLAGQESGSEVTFGCLGCHNKQR